MMYVLTPSLAAAIMVAVEDIRTAVNTVMAEIEDKPLHGQSEKIIQRAIQERKEALAIFESILKEHDDNI